MKILIWDNNSSRCSANKEVVADAAKELRLDIQLYIWTGALAPRAKDSIPVDFKLLLLHGTNAPIARQWLKEKKIRTPYILEYGGDPVPGGVPRPISDTNPFKDWEVAAILRTAANASSTEEFTAEVSKIWRGQIEARLALLLLCEAWLMTRDDETKGKSNGSERQNRIIVNAPTKPEEWFRPFGKELKNVPDSTKREAAESAAVEIACRMGEARADVEAFLRKLAERFDGESNAHFDRASFQRDISNLAAKLKSAAH